MKNRSSVVAAILQNGEILNKAYTDALNSAGSSSKELNTYLDSIQGRIDQFNNALQTMWMNFISDDVVKWIVDLGTSIVKLVDQFGALNTLTGTFAGVKGAISSIKKELDAINKDSSKVLNIFGRERNAKDIKDTAKAIKNVTNAKKAEAKVTKTSASAEQQQAQAARDSGNAKKQETSNIKVSAGAKQADTAETIKNTLATRANKIATEALAIAKGALKGFLIGMAMSALTNVVTGIISAHQEAKERMNELTENAVNAADELNDTKKDLDNYKESVQDLRKILDDNTTSEEDAYNARSQLIDIQNQLIERFGKEAEGINLVAGAIDGQLAKIDELTKKSATNWLNDYAAAYENARNEIDKTHDSSIKLNKFLYTPEYKEALWRTNSPERDKIIQDFNSKSDFLNKGFSQKVQELGGSFSVDRIATYTDEFDRTLEFKGKTIDEIDAAFTELMNYVRDQAYENSADLLSILSEERNKYVNDDYLESKRLYEQGRQQEAYANYAPKYGAILSAQEDFYQATTNEDKLSKIEDFNQKVADAFIAAGGSVSDGVFTVDEESDTAHMQEFFKDMQNKFAAEEFELNIKTPESELRTEIENIINQAGENGLSSLTDVDLTNMVGRDLNVKGATDTSGQYTDEQISMLAQLQAMADNAGYSIEDLIKLLVELKLIAGAPIKDTSAGLVAEIAKSYSTLSQSIESLNTAMSASEELFANGIKTTEDYYKSLVELGIESDDLSQCIDKENGYIVTNAEKLQELLKLKKEEIAVNAKLSRAHAELEYSNIIQSISDQISSTTVLDNVNQELVDSLFDQARAIKTTISQYKLLENSLLGVTNAFTEFSKAQEMDSKNTYGSTLTEMAQTMYDAIYKTGQVGTEAFWAAVRATVPDDVYMGLAPGEQQINAIKKYLQDNLFSGFTIDGNSFTIDYKSIESFVKKAQSKGLFSGTDTSEFGLSFEFTSSLKEGEDGLKKFAEQMGVTEEYVYAILSEMDKYNTNGIGLSMLFQLDSSTTSQLTVLNTQLEQALTTRKRLLAEGGNLDANTAEIYSIQAQQADVKALATANTSKYLTVANAIKDPTQKVKDVLSEELILEIGLNGEDTVESAFQQIGDYLLQFDEPTVVELDVSKDKIQERMNEIEGLFGDGFETTFNAYNNGDVNNLNQEQQNALAEYSRLAKIDQYIDDAMSSNLTTTESLLTQIATNTSIMAGTEEASSKKEASKNNNNTNDNSTNTPQAEKPLPNTLGMDVYGNVLKLQRVITNKQMEISKFGEMNFQQQYEYDTLAKIARQSQIIKENLANGVISAEDAWGQFQKLQEETRSFGVTIPVEFTVDKNKMYLGVDEATQETESGIGELGDTAKETEDKLKQLYTVNVQDSEAIKMLQGIEDKTKKLSDEDAAILGLSVDEGAVWTVQAALDVIIARNKQLTSGLYNVKQTSIDTYSELKNQVSSYNDILSQSMEVVSENTEVSQEYHDALVKMADNKADVIECFGDETSLIVKDTKALERLVKSAKKNTAQNVKLAKSQSQLEYYELVKQLNESANVAERTADTFDDLSVSFSDNTLYEQLDQVKLAIYQYQLLEQQLLGTTNAFEQFKKAQEIDQQNTYGDSYIDMAQTMYDAFYKTGQVGTEANWAAIQALVPDEVYQSLTSDADKMKAIYDYFNKNILPTLTLDNDNLSLEYNNIEDFVEKGIESGVFEGNIENFDLVEGMNLEEAAKLMGMTETQAYAMFSELDKYNTSRGEQSFLGQLDDSTSGQIMEVTTEIEELNRQKRALLEDGGYDSNKDQIDEINEKLSESEGKLQELGEQSYQTWQDYTKNDAALQALGAVSDKSQLLTEEMAQQLGINFDENSGKTIQQVYDALLAEKLQLEAPTVLTAQLAIDNIDTQIEELQTALETGDYTEVDPVLVGLEVGDVPTKADVEAKLAALNEDKALIATTFGIELSEEDKASLKEELNSIEEFTINDKTFKVVANGTSIVNIQLLAVKALLDKLKDKTINIKTNYTSTGTPPSTGGGSPANGTAHAQGTAFKGGDWRAQATDKNSIVGELGPEILVRNGRWQTIGENGAEFTEVRKGDIIFNHKQTEQLLKNGYVTGRGKAFAEGTAYSGLWTPTSSGSGNGKNNNKSSGGKGSSKSSKDDSGEVFDWFEVLLEEINEQLDLMNAKLENAVGISAKNSLLDQIINVNKNKFATLKQGLDLYKNYANSILEEIPSEYRKMAQDGAVAIEEFAGDADEKTLETINNYREWAQKVADLTQQMEELNTEISTLAKQKIDNIATEYENKISIPNSIIDQYDVYNSLLETDAGYESENIYKAMIAENNKNIPILQKQRNEMQAELNKQVEAGNIKKYSQDWYDAVNSIAEVDTQIIELRTDTEDYQDAINELHWDKFDDLMSRLEAVSDEAENLIDILSSKDLVNKDTGEWTKEGVTALGLYAQKMEAAEVQAKKYEEEIKYLNKNWKQLGYTEQEYVEKLEELKSGQYDAIKAYEDTKDAIVDLNKERVDAIKNIINKEIESYEKLISAKKKELETEKD